ncbi:MAG: hypothetical protein WBO30_15590 [Ferruginibacter sp.]
MKKAAFWVILCSTGIVFSSCKKGDDESSYAIATASLSVSPVDTSQVSGLVPLGNLNPPGHTFPTDHMYFYFKNPGVSVPVYAPGNLHIFQISRFRNNPGTPGATEDYSIDFGSQSGTLLYFSHVSSLSPALLAAADAFSGASCESYSTGGSTIEFCRKSVSLDINAGEIIGSGNEVAGQFALDMGFRVNNIAVCPLDYFNAGTKVKLEAKLGNSNGTVKRITAPICGEYNQDLSGTLQGNWYKQGVPRSPEDNHIAFVKDNVEPEKLRISIGSAVPGLPSAVYNFTQTGAGVIDRPFISVTNTGQIFCYNPLYYYGAPVPGTSIIVKLEDNGTLSFEKRNCDCSCNLPYAFSAAKISYTR